jgi:F-type H+-transporting ATPase subunit a
MSLANIGLETLGGLLAAAPGGSPLDHVVQHAIKTVPADWGMLTPDGVITVLSDHITMILAAGLLLALFLPLLVKKRAGTGEVDRLVPTGSANLIEAVCQYLRKEVAEPALHEHTDRFIKFLWTLFFFILTMNLLGLIPLGAVTPLFGAHIGGTATANIWVTGTLALLALGMFVVNGLRIGGMHYLAHFNPGPWWLAPLLVPLEIFGLLAKAFSLAVRLFANMMAGHVLLAVLVGLVLTAGTALGTGGGLAIGLPVVLGSVGISMLEVFVAFLQAFIFTFLTALFLGMSVVFHHDHHDDHAGAHAH